MMIHYYPLHASARRGFSWGACDDMSSRSLLPIVSCLPVPCPRALPTLFSNSIFFLRRTQSHHYYILLLIGPQPCTYDIAVRGRPNPRVRIPPPPPTPPTMAATITIPIRRRPRHSIDNEAPRRAGVSIIPHRPPITSRCGRVRSNDSIRRRIA